MTRTTRLLRLPPARDSRMLLQAQLPFDGVVLLLTLFIFIAHRQLLLSPEITLALALVIGATLLAVFVPWRRISHRWLIGVALIDVIAVAILRDSTTGVLAGVGILIVFPVLFLAYSFSLRVLIVAIASALFVVTYPFLRIGALPSSAQDWGNIVVVPTTVCFIAIAVHYAAQRFREQRGSLREVATELSTAKQASSDRQFTINAIASSVDAGILVYDTQGRIVLINQPARDLITRTGVSVQGTDNSELMVYEADGTTSVGMRRHDFAAILRDIGLRERLLVIGSPDEEQTALSVTSHNIHRDSGELLGTVVVGHDVTSFVEAANDRNLFLETMSHELRTPLTSILGYLEIVEDSIDGDAAGIAVELEVIHRNADRLNALTAALLSVASGPRPFQLALVKVDRIVADSLAASRADAERARVDLRNTTTDAVVATCDPALFREVVDHLVSNAIKYTQPNGSVDVTLATNAADVVLTVHDTGRGIADDEKAHVFDQFFRGRVARQQAVQGVGIGLSIVKDAVAAHGGTVDIASTSGAGTTVTVRIPARPEGLASVH